MITALLAMLPNWGKYVGAALLGAVLIFGPYLYGKHVGKTETQAEAARIAFDRIAEMEKNDAAFKNKPAHDRCLIFMRDSGLPSDECDKR